MDRESRKKKKAKYRMWTMPMVVEGPFGVISAAELIGIGAFCAYLVWVAGVYAVERLIVVIENPEYDTLEKWTWIFKFSGRGCGLAGMFCLSFMFIPVTRGSPILRMLNISMEHGIRYHIWLGTLSMCLFTFHGLFYLTAWFLSDEILSKIISWTSTEGANLAGIICIFFGWAIWITSLPFVRPQNFELFYYTHHLYVLFIIFLAMHVGNFLFCIVAGSIFLFIIDQFLRFCQSRTTVDVILATSFHCGVIQLIMAIPPSLKYNALSTVFIQIKELSWLQWHPFSISNSCLDGKNQLSVLVKDCGNWTSQLHHQSLNIEVANDYSTNLIASVEGPYGYHISYHLTYEYLILVAGGIGIAPFVAVLSDVINRIKMGKPCLPRNIVLVWVMKTTDELCLTQSTIDMETIRSIPFEELHLQILIHVTQQSQPLSENDVNNQPVMCSSIGSASNGKPISFLTSLGSNRWFAAYIISSTIGLLILLSIVNLLYVTPYEIVNWWVQALLLLACMVASVPLFGSATIRLWQNSGKDDSIKKNHFEQITDDVSDASSFLEYFGSSTIFHYGSRPEFKEIFGSISTLWGNVDVGVIVCGPQSLEKSVAKECRSHNFKRQSYEAIFHFFSHSFSL